MSLYTLENEAFASLVKYGSLVLAKMVFMLVPIGYYRSRSKVFLNEEDVRMQLGVTDKDEIKKYLAPDPDVERARRAHMNDIENILPFGFIALFYISTNPNPATAALLFKIFAASRIAHSVTYVCKLQPFRSISFVPGMMVTGYMLFETMRVFW